MRTIVIALDGLCWPGFAAACRQGRVPNLARLAAAGATGLMRGVPQQGRIAAATSLATGVWPETSGVWFPSEAWAGGGRPLTLASWQRLPVSATLGAAGIDTASIAWPGIAPGAALPGLHIDDRYPLCLGQTADGWALPPDCCPPAWRDELADRRIHPTAITTQHLLPLVPELGMVDQGATDALSRLATAMAEAATAQGAAAWVLADRRPTVAMVWLRWLGDIRAAATGAAVPFDHLVNGAWTFLDTLVGALAALCNGERLLVVGTGWGEAPGLVLLRGPGIAAGSGLPPAHQIDLAPTLLACHDLVDADLAGRQLPIAGLATPRRRIIAPTPTPSDDSAAAELLASLRAEGFHPPPPPPAQWHAARALRLGQMLLSRDPVAAEAAADAALASEPDNPDALTLKAWCRYIADDAAGVAAIGDALLRIAADRPWGALARGAAAAIAQDAAAARPWLAAAATGDSETRLRVAWAWLRLKRPADANPLLDRLAAELPGRIEVRLAQAAAAEAVGDSLAAEASLRAALSIDPYDVAAWVALEALLRRFGRRNEAAAATAMLAQLQGP